VYREQGTIPGFKLERKNGLANFLHEHFMPISILKNGNTDKMVRTINVKTELLHHWA
jgi:hypothetical protein